MELMIPRQQLSAEDDQCHLVVGTYALFLQLFLGFAAFLTLFYKRALEEPPRPWLVWFFDSSKQGFGALLVHFWNIGLSVWISMVGDAFEGAKDECALYFLNFTLDVVVGTFLIWLLLRGQRWLALRWDIAALQRTGDYGKPPSVRVYLAQLVTYLLILLAVKTALAVAVVAALPVLRGAVTALFAPIRQYPDVELTVVMIVCPWMMNTCQFWVLDNVLSHKRVTVNGYDKIEEF
ncbi:unnamed protein product [Phaeothamnion confervicola]